MDAAERGRVNRSVSKRVVNKDKLTKVAVNDEGQQQEQKERGKGRAMENMKSGFRRFLQDLSTPRHFEFKMIYFSLLGG